MDSLEKIKETAAHWVAKRHTAQWSSADETQLNDWLDASIGHRVEYLGHEKTWRDSKRIESMRAGGGSSDIVPATEQRSRAWVVGVAASLLIVCAGTVLGWMHLHGQRGDFYRTEFGVITALPLSDGSRITLNTASEIRLAIDHSGREVELKHGEAFFEVAHDPSRPFSVDAGGRRITVVGTKFSVRHEHGDLRVVVTEGKVSLSDSDVILRAGTIANAKQGESMTVQERTPAQAEELLSWRDGYLTFDETPLAEAIAEFNRYNARKLVIADAALASLPVSGHFRWTSIESFARLLEEGFPVVVAREDDRVVLGSRQQSPRASEPEQIRRGLE